MSTELYPPSKQKMLMAFGIRNRILYMKNVEFLVLGELAQIFPIILID
jgi:hypothetical protein